VPNPTVRALYSLEEFSLSLSCCSSRCWAAYSLDIDLSAGIIGSGNSFLFMPSVRSISSSCLCRSKEAGALPNTAGDSIVGGSLFTP